MKKVLFISSCGGHLTELLQLEPMFKDYNYHIITEKTKNNLYLKDKYKKKVNFLIYGTKDHMLTYPFKLLANCFLSLYYFLKLKPEYVITTGTHTAGPMCLIAHIFKRKVIYIETFANAHTKTATGKLIYKFADLFVVQWESMKDVYPNSVYGGWIF